MPLGTTTTTGFNMCCHTFNENGSCAICGASMRESAQTFARRYNTMMARRKRKAERRRLKRLMNKRGTCDCECPVCESLKRG